MAAERASVAQTWQRWATERGWAAVCLLPLAALYGALLRLRHWGYRSGLWRTERLDVPVIVVGNVVVGGAGKTPTVIALVQALRERGWTPGVISRGHGRALAERTLAVGHDSPAADVGDEPLLIHQATQAPVFVAQQRLQAGRALRAAHPEVNVIVADDGLQHWALHRDVNVVVFDDRGLGNGWLLPAGLLREPWPPRPPHLSQALVLRHSNPAQPNRAPVPVLSGMADFTLSRTLSPQAINACGQTRHWADWGHTPVNAVAGVARPEVFFEMLRQGGLSALRPHALPDHAQASDYDAVCADHAHDCLCTDKDAVKLFDRADIDPARVWRVPLTLSHETDWLDAVIARLPTRL